MSRSLNKLGFIVWLLLMSYASAQNPPGTLRGRVADPTGAVIPNATVTATASNGHQTSAVTDNRGAFEIKGLAPGSYTVTTSATGFALSVKQNVAVQPGQVQQFDIALEIEVEKEKLEVQEENVTVSTSASDNASSLLIKGKDLEALSDDPDELQQDLEALAGPSAGPNGGQVYIDGFTGGQLPPKSSIREIRINQNPFSSEYDKLGYGRIEIFTKPGTDNYHGEFFLDGNDSAFNSLNPFTPDVPAYNSELFHANVGGPLNKKASFFFNVEGRHIDDSNIVNATTPTGQLIQAVPNPRSRINVGPRIDYQLTKNNTLTVRYQFFHNTEDNDGVGQFSLASQAYNSTEDEHTLQISDTQVVSNNVINETRFQYNRDNTGQTAQSFEPTIMVLGAFTGGGNQLGNLTDYENRYELQNYTSVVHHTHLIKFGARLRETTDSSASNANFNGVFTFPSIMAYAACQQSLLNHGACQGATGPSQFSITAGQPLTQVSVFDAGLYAGDDWRVRPNFTLSYGLRFETQNQIHDHADWAPRLSLAWGLGRGNNPSPKTVLRAGFGIFYDRFAYNLIEQAERLNGITQQQTIVNNPDFFPAIPSLPIAGAAVSPTIYQVSPRLVAPMTLQSAASVERQLTKSATLAVTYLNSRGEHQLFLRNINAPLPGTYTGPGTGIRPLGGTENIYQYDSEGIFRQNQLITNVRINVGARLSLFGYYTLNYANSDLGSGAGSGGAAGFFSGGATSTPNFLSNQYDPMADYGRALFDVRHRVFLGGTISMPYAFRLNPFMLISSGVPYDITLGQDLNGDSIFNDRPALVSTMTCPTVGPAPGQPTSVVCTPLGTFNTLPAAGEAVIPVNSATGPTLFTLNLRLSKTFGFGRETKGGGSSGGPNYGGGRRGGGGGLGPGGLSSAGRSGGGMMGGGVTTGRRYNLTFSVSARNVLNRVNLGTPIGELSSPQFAQSISLAGGPFSSAGASRRIDLQVLFSF
ncbi:MAG TPA: carboxypeptidase regulatory-like domain-containing protein [Terriglobales bacterium]|nr:carboxypeptidase regulatory-like domain-containing protein [Terriglobales bacterium]